jgi:hypothetical protein
MSEDIEKRIGQYVQIRDAIKRLKERHSAEMAPLLSIQEKLSGLLEAAMDASNTDGLKSKAGTCYRSTRYTASLADPDAFMRYVVANNAFDLIDRRANAAAVKDFVEANNQLPPGCNLNAIRTVGVTRAPGT